MFGLIKEAFGGFQGIVISATIALIVGFGSGFYVEHQFANASVVKQAAKDQQKVAKEIDQSLVVSQSVDSAIAKNDTKASIVKREIDARLLPLSVNVLKLKEKTNDTSVNCPNWNLDAGTVRLLNSVRSEQSGNATGVSNGSSTATSEASGKSRTQG